MIQSSYSILELYPREAGFFGPVVLHLWTGLLQVRNSLLIFRLDLHGPSG
jgi:hypothetical protein